MSRSGKKVRGLTRAQFITSLRALGYDVPDTGNDNSLIFGAILQVATELADAENQLQGSVDELTKRADQADGRLLTSFNQG